MQLLDVLESAVLLLLTGEHKKGSYASGGRSLRFMESDEQLANWVRERRKEKVRVTRRMIQQQAIKMFPLVTKENIINSFKYCGLTNKTNGAEDDEIHCFKINGPVSEGRAQLRQARLDNELAKIFEEIDLEEDVENGNESDNSIEM
uniref:HTH CENPB-type domain-containing protein n=5 Tax=Meloidogyne TaxID=189290 RepID=A0A914L668_MELIC|nr:unnamed protein product [Meloidogyne enterolobii]